MPRIESEEYVVKTNRKCPYCGATIKYHYISHSYEDWNSKGWETDKYYLPCSECGLDYEDYLESLIELERRHNKEIYELYKRDYYLPTDEEREYYLSLMRKSYNKLDRIKKHEKYFELFKNGFFEQISKTLNTGISSPYRTHLGFYKYERIFKFDFFKTKKEFTEILEELEKFTNRNWMKNALKDYEQLTKKNDN